MTSASALCTASLRVIIRSAAATAITARPRNTICGSDGNARVIPAIVIFYAPHCKGRSYPRLFLGRLLFVAVSLGPHAGLLHSRGAAQLRGPPGLTGQLRAHLHAFQPFVQFGHVGLAHLQNLVLVVDGLAAIVGGHLEVVAHDQRFDRADFHTEAAVEAARLVDVIVVAELLAVRVERIQPLHIVVLEGVPLVRMIGVLGLVLDDADGDRIHGADLRAETTADAFLAPGGRVRQEAHRAPEARRQFAQVVGVLHGDCFLEHRAQSQQEPCNLIRQFHLASPYSPWRNLMRRGPSVSSAVASAAGLASRTNTGFSDLPHHVPTEARDTAKITAPANASWTTIKASQGHVCSSEPWNRGGVSTGTSARIIATTRILTSTSGKIPFQHRPIN